RRGSHSHSAAICRISDRMTASQIVGIAMTSRFERYSSYTRFILPAIVHRDWPMSPRRLPLSALSTSRSTLTDPSAQTIPNPRDLARVTRALKTAVKRRQPASDLNRGAESPPGQQPPVFERARRGGVNGLGGADAIRRRTR